jgi:hypothetical protein
VTDILPRLAETYERTRAELQRVAVHVLARRRYAVSGRFGLRATPGGFGTPAFGDPLEVVRLAGMTLVHEVGGDVSAVPLSGASLADLAQAVGADLATEFSAGEDTPALGDLDAPLSIDEPGVAAHAVFLHLGWRALDAIIASAVEPATLQLWPEHFDAGTSISLGTEPNDRANLGASSGDAFHPAPYLYVGPWDDARPGDAGYWNAPFGAIVGYDALAATTDPMHTAIEFFRRGIGFLTGAPT